MFCPSKLNKNYPNINTRCSYFECAFNFNVFTFPIALVNWLQICLQIIYLQYGISFKTNWKLISLENVVLRQQLVKLLPSGKFSKETTTTMKTSPSVCCCNGRSATGKINNINIMACHGRCRSRHNFLGIVILKINFHLFLEVKFSF